MAGFSYRHGLVACLAALAGFGCWQMLAVTGVEDLAFSAVLRGFAKPPIFRSGRGTLEDPWAVRTLAVKAKVDARKAPVVVSIGDDPGGVFQTSPPSPVDFAVVLQNLRRLGAKQAAIAAVMAWEKPDPFALKGLENVLNEFEMLVHAAPLSRGTVRQAMPPAFRRAALSPEAIHGDISRLPIINRVAVPDVIFGGDRALAGFTALDDADAGTGTLPLLARWEEEERVVLAFPLLAVLARYDLPVSGIQVQLGGFLQLGPAGPVIPIDRDGRMALPLKPVASRVDVLAESLILGTPEIFPAEPGLIVLRDDQTTAPRATKRFSANLAAAIASIGSDAGLGPACHYRRLSAAWEALLLTAAVVLLVLVAGWSRFQRLLACGILAAVCLAAQWLAVGLAQVWLPGIPLLAAVLAGALVLVLSGEARPAPRPLAAPAVPAVVEASAPRVATTPGRGFRSVTIWKEPLSGHGIRETVPAAIEPVPEVPAPVPEVPAPAPEVPAPAPEVVEPAGTPRKTAVRKAGGKKVPAGGSPPNTVSFVNAGAEMNEEAAGGMPAPPVARASCPEPSVTKSCANLTALGSPPAAGAPDKRPARKAATKKATARKTSTNQATDCDAPPAT